MKRVVLLLWCFISLQMSAQVPSKNVRAANCIVLLEAMNYLNVPLYLDSPVNSSRIYSWYKTTSSFGVTAKASETPIHIEECQYSIGHLTSLRIGNITYSFIWDGGYLSRITKYDQNGQIPSGWRDIRLGEKDVLLYKKPRSLEYALDYKFPYRAGNAWPPENCDYFIKRIYVSNDSKTATGCIYWVDSESYLGVLTIKGESFRIKKKGGLSKKSYYTRTSEQRKYTCESDGRFTIEFSGYSGCHFDNSLIEEVSINY